MAKDPKKPNYELYGLYISRVQGTDDEYYAHWELNVPSGDGEKLECVEYQWYYTMGDAHIGSGNIQMYGSGGRVDYYKGGHTSWAATYTPPKTAKKISISIIPVSRTYTTSNGDEKKYLNNLKRLTSGWVDIDKIPTVVDNLPIINLTTFMQSEESRVVVAQWDPDPNAKCSDLKKSSGTDKNYYLKNYVDSYMYEWRYAIGSNFYVGTEGTVEGNIANRRITYTPPEDAWQVAFRIKAVPMETKPVKGFNIPWFKSSPWYPVQKNKDKTTTPVWHYYKIPKATTPDVSIGVEGGSINLARLQGDDKALYVTWEAPTGYTNFKTYTESYKLEWRYKIGDTWFDGSEATVDVNAPLSAQYTPDANAVKAAVRITPVPKTFTQYGTEVPRYKAKPSSWINYDYATELKTPETPSAPSFSSDEEDQLHMTTQIDTYDPNTTRVDFQFVTNNKQSSAKTERVSVATARASKEFTGTPGNTYKVRCRGVYYISSGGKVTEILGEWSEYSSDVVIPKGVNDPDTPSVPNVTMNGFNLEMSIDTYDVNTLAVEFDICKNNSSAYYMSICANVSASRASATVAVPPGNTYKVRCRGLDTTITDPKTTINAKSSINTSPWSEYSADVTTIPNGLNNETIDILVTSSTGVTITWEEVPNAESYTIEYTTNPDYFDAAQGEVQSVTIDNGTRAMIVGMESGHRYYFRLKSTNQNGDSEWSDIFNAILGTVPSAPTIWSSSTSAAVGDQVLLYWTHNSEDASIESSALLELTINGVTQEIELPNEEETYNGRRFYILETAQYTSGATVLWRVSTKGVLDEYGPMSEVRQVNVYAPPMLEVNAQYSMTWSLEEESEVEAWQDIIDNRTEYLPIRLQLTAYPASQTPVGYSLSISSLEAYDDIDVDGKAINVIPGQEIYNSYIVSSEHNLNIEIGAGDVNFQNGVMYRFTVTVGMDSGLTAEAIYDIDMDMPPAEFSLDAEIAYDRDAAVAYIRPYSEDQMGDLTPDIIMSLYRREFDGKYTLLASGLNNRSAVTVTDPHPALDYARYRVVGTDLVTGSSTFVDLAPFPTGDKSIIIQWNEEWTNFVNETDDIAVGTRWGGSMVRLPWNVDISDSNTVDVELVEYIGRSHPVSYYGTQVGQTSSWKTEFPAYDKETLYALRRLAVFMGNAYVREPSGTGYWAQVKVQISKDHCAVTSPVTLDITRVEGGI